MKNARGIVAPWAVVLIFAVLCTLVWFLPWPDWRLLVSVLVGIVGVLAFQPVRRLLPGRRFFYEIDGTLRSAEELVGTGPARRAAERIVEQVKDDYAGLLIDLCYRYRTRP